MQCVPSKRRQLEPRDVTSENTLTLNVSRHNHLVRSRRMFEAKEERVVRRWWNWQCV